MEALTGKYRALVAENNSLLPDCPYAGCVKVIQPEIFGYTHTAVPGPALLKMCVTSKWIYPHYTHPMDHYVPEVGEGVYIECLGGNGPDQMIWTGVFPGADFINQYDFLLKDGITKQAGNPLAPARVIGTRNGSYIKLEEGPTGKITIEVLGKNALVPARLGYKIILDPVGGITLQDPMGTCTEVLSPTGIVSTFGANSINVAADSITLTMGIASITIAVDSITIDFLGALGSIVIDATGITLTTGDGPLWLPNCIPTCPMIGAPHGGVPGGIMRIKGA
jgi:hypothetical protein